MNDQKFISLKEKLKSRQFNKIWMLDSFDKKSQEKTIMAEMPEHEVYLANKAKQEIERKDSHTDFAFMYTEPFLTKPQEYHLFRKYNFLKYKYKNLVEKTLWTRGLTTAVNTLEYYYSQMNEVKQQVSLSNARLVMNIARKMCVDNLEMALSDGYLGLMMAVDYFDFRRNVKFITYGYLVIQDYIRKQRYTDSRNVATVSLDAAFDLCDVEFADKRCVDVDSDLLHNERMEIINDALAASTTDRQRDIIADYYGLNGRRRLTLEGISKKSGVTKERIRQVKMAGEEKLKKHGINI